MSFQNHFYARLLALGTRETGLFPSDIFPDSYRAAAVLIPLWPDENGTIKLAMTRRSDSLPTHQGQVSFPGGGMLTSDLSLEQTALRETEEELGISRDAIRIMGRLDDAWSRFGFHVIPYVGWTDSRPDFNPDPFEVAEVIIADVETLMRPECSCLHQVETNGQQRTTHAFSWEGGYIWGLTADILLELFLWVKSENSSRAGIRLDLMKKILGQSGQVD